MERHSRQISKNRLVGFWQGFLWLLLAGSFVTLILGVGSNSTELLVSSASFIPSISLLIYLSATRQTEIFHPLNFILVSVFLGVTVQTFFLFFLDDGSHRFAVGVMTDSETLFDAIVAISIGIIFMLAGYAFSRRRMRKPVRLSGGTWSEPRLYSISVALIAISLACLAYYVAVFDVWDNIAEQFSVKRRLIAEDTGVSQTLGWVRFGINLSQIAFFLLYAHHLESAKKNRKTKFKTLMVIAGIAGFLMPVLASSRLGVLTYIIGIVIIHHYTVGGWTIKKLQKIAVVCVCIIIGMGVLRYVQTRNISYSEYSADISLTRTLAPFLGSSNYLAVGKTAVIIEAVPHKLEYQLGSSYLLWLVAPVPRSMWPNKPIVRIGAVLGEGISGTTLRGGVPPGSVGELYLNFGWFGIPFGMFLFGMLLRWFTEKFCMYSYQDMNTRVIYASTIIFIAFTGLSADFTGMVSMTLQRLLPILVVLKLLDQSHQIVTQKRRQRHLRTR